MKTSLRFTPSLLFLLACNLLSTTANATFSIVAVDPVTREVGSAGATCIENIDLRSYISYLVPGRGAVNFQAASDPAYFPLAANRILAGDTAPAVMAAVNNSDNRVQSRQRIMITLNGSDITTAGFQGSRTFSYANSIEGQDYVIAGNILQGQHVLSAIENAFNNAQGDLTHKLMKALQGATAIIGADTRCSSRGTSSGSAYIRVSKPTDAMNNPSFFLHTDSIIGGLDPINGIYNQYLAIRPDSDGDGTVDLIDQLPGNSEGLIDTDRDDVSNINNAFPLDPTETLDTDNDGIGDNAPAISKGEIRTSLPGNRCASVWDADVGNGARTVLWDCAPGGAPSQQYTFEPYGDSPNEYRVKAQHSGKCLAVAERGNGEIVQQWACENTAKNAIWKLELQIEGYRLRNKLSNRCMAVWDGDPANGTKLVQWDCADSQNMTFEINSTALIH